MQAQTKTTGSSFGDIDPKGKPKIVKMASKLAYRNLFHDHLSLVVTLVGIVFSVVLVAVQCGLYIGSERMIAAMIDASKGDLWIVPFGTKSFDDPSFLIGHEKYTVLSTPGVAGAEELVVNFANWHKRKGGNTAVLLIGSDHEHGTLKPWNVVEGTVKGLEAPFAVAADDTYFTDLGVEKNGEGAEINDQHVAIKAVTHGIRSFTTLPYIFAPLQRARTLLGATANQSSYTLVTLSPGANIEDVRKRLKERLPERGVLTTAEFRKLSVDYWLFQTGAGAALIAGAALGMIVGVVIVAQTLYSSTKDHLNEFATLRALGASAGYIHKVILIQALMSAVLGYAVGMVLSMTVIYFSQDTTLPIVMTPGLALLLFALTIGMCVIAAMSAIFKVTRIDPAGVFSR
jgi:putative ABC transport system permease protein